MNKEPQSPKFSMEEYRRKNAAKLKAYRRTYYLKNRERLLSEMKLKFSQPAFRKRKREARLAYRAKNRHKRLAHGAVERAVKKGTLLKKPCIYCGHATCVVAHHNDYSKRLDVVWMCEFHHKAWHKLFEAENAE